MSLDHEMTRTQRGVLGLTRGDRRALVVWAVLIVVGLATQYVRETGRDSPPEIAFEERVFRGGTVATEKPTASDSVDWRDLNDALPVNTADSSDLVELPGIGPVLAGRIVRDRNRNGPYETLDDLLRVNGIGPAKLAELRRFGAARAGKGKR